MKNTIFYYLAIIIPVIPFIYLTRNEVLSDGWITLYVMTYLGIYRAIVDYQRLKSKGILKKGEFWNVYKCGFHGKWKYHKELFI